jgi:hypothetical protein
MPEQLHIVPARATRKSSSNSAVSKLQQATAQLAARPYESELVDFRPALLSHVAITKCAKFVGIHNCKTEQRERACRPTNEFTGIGLVFQIASSPSLLRDADGALAPSTRIPVMI